MRLKRSIVAILTIIAAILGTWAITVAQASAYLHVANAQNYARAHAWRTFCNYNCLAYPSATGWYQRINNNRVRVEILARKSGYGNCYRVFAVNGNDGSEYISTDGSSAYWACQ